MMTRPVMILLLAVVLVLAVVLGVMSRGAQPAPVPSQQQQNEAAVTPSPTEEKPELEARPTPPAGCHYQMVQCIKAPCPPILVCDDEANPGGDGRGKSL